MKVKAYKKLWYKIFIICVVKMVLSVFMMIIMGEKEINKLFFCVLNGMDVEQSSNLFYVMLYTLPNFIFVYYIVNTFIYELKENFVYIILRTSKYSYWWFKTEKNIIVSNIIYEVIIFLFIGFTYIILDSEQINYKKLILMILIDLSFRIMISLFSSVIYYISSETVEIISVLVMLLLPPLIVGMLYEMHQNWKIAIILCFLQWGNVRYLEVANMNYMVTIIEILFVCVLINVVMLLYLKNKNIGRKR
mgnify:CR=1 FL=1